MVAENKKQPFKQFGVRVNPNPPTVVKTKKKYYKIDDLYTHISYLSLFDKCHQMLKANPSDENIEVLGLFVSIDKSLKYLDTKFNLNLFEEENDWILNYLRSHYAFNLQQSLNNTYLEPLSVDDITFNLEKVIEVSNQNLHNIKKTKSKTSQSFISNPFNFQLYKQLESINFTNKIQYVQKELLNTIDKINKHGIPNSIILDILSLCHKNIDLDLLDMLFDLSEKLHIKNPSYQDLILYAKNQDNDIEFNRNYKESKFNNVRILLYKSYFNIVKNQLIKEYSNAVVKTFEHCESLCIENNSNKSLFSENYSKINAFLTKHKKNGGMSINKFSKNIEIYIEDLLRVIEKHNIKL